MGDGGERCYREGEGEDKSEGESEDESEDEKRMMGTRLEARDKDERAQGKN